MRGTDFGPSVRGVLVVVAVVAMVAVMIKMSVMALMALMPEVRACLTDVLAAKSSGTINALPACLALFHGYIYTS